MFTVLSRPYDDDDIVEVYIADHDTKSQAQFEHEWQVAKDKILERNPEYNVNNIIKTMERKGWKIIHVTPAKVTY